MVWFPKQYFEVFQSFETISFNWNIILSQIVSDNQKCLPFQNVHPIKSAKQYFETSDAGFPKRFHSQSAIPKQNSQTLTLFPNPLYSFMKYWFMEVFVYESVCLWSVCLWKCLFMKVFVYEMFVYELVRNTS
jgi:hypothetical protein